MSRIYHTVNDVYPHPDDDGDPEPMPLNEAIAWACKVLHDQTADQWTRVKAAGELRYSFECLEAEK